MTNHIQEKKNKINHNTARVCDLMQWSLALYNEKQYEAAIQYLQQYFDGDEEAVTLISSGTAFWGWFIAMWDARNEAFLHEFDGKEDKYHVDQFRKWHGAIHLVDTMLCEIAPPPCIYPEGFTTVKMQIATP